LGRENVNRRLQAQDYFRIVFHKPPGLRPKRRSKAVAKTSSGALDIMVADEADALCQVVAEGAAEKGKSPKSPDWCPPNILPVIGKAVLRIAVFRAQSPEKAGFPGGGSPCFAGRLKGFHTFTA
jgi:hypothetical protein